MDIDKIIADYLSTKGRRIIIPGFGALIKRDNGETVLMELLRHDDGVLAEEITEKEGISREEADKAIAEYVAALRSESADDDSISTENVEETSELKDIESTKPSSPPNDEAPTVTPQRKQVTEIPEGEIVPVQAVTAKPTIKIKRRATKKRRIDAVMIVAIVAILLGIAALAYGYMVDKGSAIDLNQILVEPVKNLAQ